MLHCLDATVHFDALNVATTCRHILFAVLRWMHWRTATSW